MGKLVIHGKCIPDLTKRLFSLLIYLLRDKFSYGHKIDSCKSIWNGRKTTIKIVDVSVTLGKTKWDPILLKNYRKKKWRFWFYW